MSHVIYALHVVDRAQAAPKVQGVLTKYGMSIKTRFGSHDPRCGAGVIVLEMMGAKEEYAGLEGELAAIGVEVKIVEFECK